MAILNHLMRKVLPDVDMLCTLSSADDVAPFDACVVQVVLVYWSITLRYKAHENEKRAKIDDLHCHCRCRIVFHLSSGQRSRLLEFRFPKNRSAAI